MKRKTIFKFLSTVWISMFLLSSCNNINLADISKDLKIDETLVIPIGEGSASISDILSKVVNDSNLFIDADTINYVSNYSYDYVFKPIDILQYAVPRNIVINGFVAGTINANSAVQLPGTSNYTVDLGLDPASTSKRVDSTYVSSTAIGITVTASNITVASNGSAIVPSDLKVTLGFPKIYNQGNRSSVNVPVPYSFGTEYGLQLNNVIVDTHGQTGVPVTVSLTSGNRPIKVNASSVINININFNKVNFSVSYGLFQPSSVQTTTIVLPLDMLSAIPEGLTFANPKATISLTSDIGTYLQFNIESIKAYSKDGSNVKQGTFKNGSLSTTEVIDVKPMTPKDKAITKRLHTFDRNYGSLDQLLDRSLDTLEYKFSLTTADALNDTSSTPSFITPGMSIKANIKIEVPLYFKSGSNFTLTDTIPNIDIPFENVDSAILVLKVTNALPVKATFSMKFLDASNHVITSSLNALTYVINSGEVNSSGIVTAETVSPINIELTKTQANEIKDAKSMVYSLVLEGYSKTVNGVLQKYPIQITKNNYIKVKLGAYVKGGITTTIGSNN